MTANLRNTKKTAPRTLLINLAKKRKDLIASKKQTEAEISDINDKMNEAVKTVFMDNIAKPEKVKLNIYVTNAGTKVGVVIPSKGEKNEITTNFEPTNILTCTGNTLNETINQVKESVSEHRKFYKLSDTTPNVTILVNTRDRYFK
tara:strand:- start:1842 stop:2279 length:438 start_codon:yes stop_codon:yes gene_type:complete